MKIGIGMPIPDLSNLPGSSRPGGGGTPVPPPLAQVNNVYSMDFDGTNDYIDFGDSDIFSFTNGTTDSPFSVSAWVKPDNLTLFRLIGKNGSAGDEWVFTTTSADKLTLFLYQNTTSNRIFQSSGALTSTDWQHWAATYDGSGAGTGINIYINGTNVNDSSGAVGSYTAMQNTTSSLKIGESFGQYASGKIDEVAVFNTALTAQEVQSIYNATETGKTADLNDLTTPPVKWYRMGD